MTKIEAKIEALRTIWGWASKHHEGNDFGEYGLGDELQEDIYSGRYTRAEAKKIAKEFYLESARIGKRISALRNRQ